MKTIIDNIKLKNFINEDWRFFIITLANYKSLINNQEILENNEYENQLIMQIKFFSILKDEINTNNMLNIALIEIYDNIQEECWKRKIIYMYGAFIDSYSYFDKKLKQKIIDNYNKKIKHSNQNYKKHIINNHFKTNIEKKQYENWKENYFKSLNEKITKNRIEQGIDAFDYFKDEVNSVELQNKPTTSVYKLSNLKI